jgi:hypothetical protein
MSNSERNYYRFTEVNDWEGETWHFYIPMTQSEFDIVKDAITSTDPDNPYRLANRAYTEVEVDKLIKDIPDDCGYMNAHNKCGNITPETLETIKTYNPEDEDVFYKGQCWNRTG